jgi:hypothetical protein
MCVDGRTDVTTARDEILATFDWVRAAGYSSQAVAFRYELRLQFLLAVTATLTRRNKGQEIKVRRMGGGVAMSPHTETGVLGGSIPHLTSKIRGENTPLGPALGWGGGGGDSYSSPNMTD